jgi:hypothetical protein
MPKKEEGRTGLFERRCIIHLPLFSTYSFWDSFTVEGVEWTAHEEPYARTEDLGLAVGHPRCNGKDESNEEEAHIR